MYVWEGYTHTDEECIVAQIHEYESPRPSLNTVIRHQIEKEEDEHLQQMLKPLFCKECGRILLDKPHTFEECVVAQVHEEENEFNNIFNRPLRKQVFYMTQEDWDDVVKWATEK